MKNNYTKTELPITIITDDEHKTGDNLELTRQRIEKATLYIHSLFNSIRYSLENLPSFDDQKLEEIIWDARNVCELGYGVADSILASASCLTEFQPDDKNEIQPESNLDSLAAQISSLLNNSDMPDELYNAIVEGLDKVAEFSNNKTLSEYEKSAGYIESILTDYGKEKSEARNE